MTTSGPRTTVRLWGYEFEWRNSGSMPLRYRKDGGCNHDWVLVSFDHPLVGAVREVFPPPEQETVEQRVRHIIGDFLRRWGFRQGMNNPGNVVQTGDLYRELHAAGLLVHPATSASTSEDQ